MEPFTAPQLFIDKDGQWFADGALMIRREIVQLFSSHLRRSESGGYEVFWQGQAYPVSVEDAPFCACSVSLRPEGIFLLLTDGREIELSECGLQLKGDIPYAALHEAGDIRLSRAAYQQLLPYIKQQGQSWLLQYEGQRWSIAAE